MRAEKADRRLSEALQDWAEAHGFRPSDYAVVASALEPPRGSDRDAWLDRLCAVSDPDSYRIRVFGAGALLGVFAGAAASGALRTTPGLVLALFVPALIWLGAELLVIVNPAEERSGWKVLLILNPATLFFVVFVAWPMMGAFKLLDLFGSIRASNGTSVWRQWLGFHIFLNVILAGVMLSFLATRL